MKSLDLSQMEIVTAGECYSCGQAVFMAAAMGSWFFGGIGAAIGAGLAALGPNCLDMQDTGACE
ncbi:MAG: hypothetical protein GKR88_09920 [Flavobacteriaceae bacterium]|nr:MAG: hypothetical protein GKR88_09920 [Flavobacteriaceae bacterium]